ncbi:unnamed protein product [Euphydryas editha]|uniref:Uncharacterized protein n=1 Tax=Euphydryas editha TaxID=104508 RepID=A0AAU9V655_EUPED|nr:unnamed protein product [Euphydryas editha]
MAPYVGRCFNPFLLTRHNRRVKVRKISKTLKVENFARCLCVSCTKRLLFESPSEANIVQSQSSQASSDYSQTTKMKLSFRKTSTNTLYRRQTYQWKNEEISNQLKEKSNNPSTSIKTMILIIAPKFWSENRLAQEFGTSRRHAKKAKQLVEQFDILTSPNPIDGRKLPTETESLVKNYLRKDISRVMPGRKDFVSIKLEDG